MNAGSALWRSIFRLDRGLTRLIIVCALLLGVTYFLRTHPYLIPARYFLPVHLLLELSSVVVSFAVFTTGWFGYKQTGNSRDLVIAVTFFAVGLLDLIHTLSYQGMPDFLGAGSPGKAAAYWTLARLVAAVGLLGASLIRPPFKVRYLNSAVLGTAAAVIIILFTTIATVYDTAFAHLFFDPVTKLTPLKIGLEVLIMVLYAVAFVTFSTATGLERRAVDLLRAALLVAILTELAFTLYQSPFGYINALGHVFKTLSFYLILSALFVSAIQKPYDELSEAKEELQRLYLHAQEHREEIERSFSRIGSALSSSLRLDEALDQIAQLAVDMLHADCSIVASLDKTQHLVRVSSHDETCQDLLSAGKLTDATSEMVMREQRTVLIDNLQSSSLAGVCCDDSGPCLRSMLCSPMIYDGRVMGMVAVYAHAPKAFDKGDLKLIEGFASHAAVATQNAISYERESRIADVLQRSILSSAKVVTDKFEIAQVYEPATNESLVGGDFYDVFQLPDGKIGLAIGDVSGKGLKAAVHTAMVKYSLRAYASEGRTPVEAMRLLDKIIAGQTGPETFITMFYGVLDTDSGELIYTNAGHEPPVYNMDGTSLTLPPTGPALGLGVRQAFSEAKAVLEKDSTLLLYTDGISEARHGLNFLGTEGIGEELNVCGLIDSEDVAKCVHKAAIRFAGGELKDDAAILAVRAL